MVYVSIRVDVSPILYALIIMDLSIIMDVSLIVYVSIIVDVSLSVCINQRYQSSWMYES